MAPDVFDRETMLDLSVNVIPLFIILFFVVVFAVISPFGYALVPTTIQMALLIVPFVGLAILTYYSGKAIAQSEAELEARERAVAGASEVESSDEETESVTGEETRALEDPAVDDDADTEAETDTEDADADPETTADDADDGTEESAN
ncbi:DUF6684 family protein [Halomarina oriensis]|uniref:Cox cluster protein n=1 Tax=Halomarina oriensis TaxID=671145 RepID=A0A6B0GXE9_9EURY|nr:DUF6684 family protein [Halomarina oriensis]MWG36448.1 cox cluster protein [Halomarina oriensis]